MVEKKRGYGEGSIIPHGKNLRIQYYINGRRIRESVRSCNRADAERLLRRRLAEIEAGTYDGPPQRQVKFEDLRELLIADYKLNQRKTLKRVVISLNRLQSFLSGMPVSKINPATINAYIIWRLDMGVAAGTINRELAALKRSLHLAKIEGFIRDIPYIKMLTEPPAREGFIEHEQFLSILKHLPPHLKPPFKLAYLTGLRSSELFGLTRDQVHIKEGYIRLDPAATKTSEARTIYLPPEGIVALKEAMKVHALGCNLVFHRNGKRIVNYYKAWRKACKAAGQDGIILHDCRRTAIRNLVRAGVPDRVAMQISGHKTRSVFDRYNITSERDLKEAAAKLEAYLSTLNDVVQNHEEGG